MLKVEEMSGGFAWIAVAAIASVNPMNGYVHIRLVNGDKADIKGDAEDIVRQIRTELARPHYQAPRG